MHYHHMLTVETLLRLLRAQGYRITPRRRHLIGLLVKYQMPLTAPELVALVNKKMATNKTTVYRELALLVRGGIVSAVSVRAGTLSYELAARRHHHHVVCTGCGDIADVDDGAIESSMNRAAAKLSKQLHYTDVRHSLEFSGLCHKCA